MFALLVVAKTSLYMFGWSECSPHVSPFCLLLAEGTAAPSYLHEKISALSIESWLQKVTFSKMLRILDSETGVAKGWRGLVRGAGAKLLCSLPGLKAVVLSCLVVLLFLGGPWGPNPQVAIKQGHC